MRQLHIFFSVFILLLSCLSSAARDYRPEDVANPNVADRRVYVADPENNVGAAAKARVNEMLYALRRQPGAEVAVAVVPSIGDLPIEDFSEKLFTSWGLGKSDKDNGVLIVIALEQRRARIQTGYGAEGVLPDISAKKIIDRQIIPAMRDGDLDAAVTGATTEVVRVMSNPEAAAELKSSKKDAWEEDPDTLTSEDIMTFAASVALVFLLAAIGLYIYDWRRSRHKDRYQKALLWQQHAMLYWLCAICSLGAALVVALLALWQYRRARNKPLPCPTCGARMRKLNEEEDNALLSPSQDFEEQIKTVDYDVWECPQCGTIERFPFKANQLKYSECPSCHTVAMCMVRDHTIVPATTRQAGVGEKVYECQFCHQQNRRRYVIPKKDDGTGAALAAGAVIGSMGRGGGGGGFGGGFGGGSTGGGGASGGW